MNIEIKEVSDQDKERVAGKVAAVKQSLEELRKMLEGQPKCESNAECSAKEEMVTKVILEAKSGDAIKVYRNKDGIVLACLDRDDDRVRCVLSDEEAKSLGTLLHNIANEDEPIQ
jgi:hypothetical protein